MDCDRDCFSAVLTRGKSSSLYVLGHIRIECQRTDTMKSLLLAPALWFALPFPIPTDQRASFRDEQSRFPRVHAAEKEKDALLRSRFAEKKVIFPPRAVLLRAFKKEGDLELWAAGTSTGPYALVHTYKICATSGTLGPKRRFGDVQVPEGFYELDWLNPESNFYLSLHVSYPNASDRILGSRENPGGDIFLHGNCVTIGCLPITDDGIKEVFWLAVLVRNSGEKHLPIEIFPARLNGPGIEALAATHKGQDVLLAFWRNLKVGYDFFERTHRLPRVRVGRDGSYEFSDEIAGRTRP